VVLVVDLLVPVAAHAKDLVILTSKMIT
jgi:hypothetical protein